MSQSAGRSSFYLTLFDLYPLTFGWMDEVIVVASTDFHNEVISSANEKGIDYLGFLT